ncbi:MAG TPA: MBL fold metallo-hydrolase [Pirellulales bacterium]|nr:MBL fold metallo-hydrolase [Pirellulales bacterium]
MQLAVLGTAGYHPNESRHTACFMLPEVGVVLDAGTGFFRVGRHLATDEIDIFLTHTHLDHVFGLTFLFDVLYGRTMKRVDVHAEAAKLAAVENHLLNELLFPVSLPCRYRALAGPVSLAGGGVLTSFALAHPGESVGFRLDWPGHSMAYVTDTTAHPTASYVERIHGVDLLVHECNFTDDNRELAELTGHSHTTPVVQVARQAEVGRLLLVHLNPLTEGDDPVGLEAATAIFPRTEVARDNMLVEF